MDHLLVISEQHVKETLKDVNPYIKSVLFAKAYQKTFFHKQEMQCFQLTIEDDNIFADTNYFIGVDWLEPKKAALYVEPKLNDKKQQVNFLRMLMESLEAPENLDHLDKLFHAEFDEPWIPIPDQKDLLSPILIVQFLKLLQKLVRKGLKKSYYRVTENLDSRIKGKILVGQQIKENIVKNRLNKTICNYQVFGINTTENQFLKLVMEFVTSYLSHKNQFFSKDQNEQLKNMLNYCSPAFEQVKVLQNKHQRINTRKNVFYREYEEAIRIGGYILKRFSFNINKASQNQTSTPPFWIDMSKLFELYVFGKLKKEFPNPDDITYHDRFMGGKETDILIREGEFKCVVDCKYKPNYHSGSPSLDDKRQVVGYTRLKSVYDRLGVDYDKLIKALIIYSHQDCSDRIDKDELFKTAIEEYIEFYKLGVRLPEL